MGRGALLKIKEQGPYRKLIGFEIEGENIASRDNEIYHREEKVGLITSGNFSPSLNKSIAIGYVKSDFASTGKELEITKDGKRLRAKVVPMPFYDPKNEKVHS